MELALYVTTRTHENKLKAQAQGSDHLTEVSAPECVGFRVALGFREVPAFGGHSRTGQARFLVLSRDTATGIPTEDKSNDYVEANLPGVSG